MASVIDDRPDWWQAQELIERQDYEQQQRKDEMTTIAKAKPSVEFTLVPPGAHPAVCVQVIDIGIQAGGKFAPTRKVYLRWQIPGERVQWTKDGVDHEGAAAIGRTFTLSLSDKSNLRPVLESWRGKKFTDAELDGFDIKNVLGAACLVQVTHGAMHDGKAFAKVATVMSMPKGMPKPHQEGELLYFDADIPDSKVFAKLSKWLQEKINGRLSDEATGSTQEDGVVQGAAAADFEDDIPFN